MTTAQVNTDPNLSEVEFLRSVLRQIAHIIRTSRETGAFAITQTVALDTIEQVIIVANGRLVSDDDVILSLRRKIGDLESAAIDTSLLTKQLGAMRASLRTVQQEHALTTAELAATRELLTEAKAAARVEDDLVPRDATGKRLP